MLASPLLLLLLAQACPAARKFEAPDAGSAGCDGSAHCQWECPADAAIDLCGECGGENRAKDCRGVCYGPATVDECGFCTDDPDPECDPPLLLAPLQSGQDDHFGEAVSLSGDSALVGAVYDDEGGEQSGAAYIFVRDPGGCLLQKKLVGDDARAGDNFGYAVAVSGSTALVGAYSDDDQGENRGSAYLFELEADQWIQRIELAPPGQASEIYYFGIAVALDEDTALIGARRYRAQAMTGEADCYTGSAFVYIRDPAGWLLQDELRAEDSTDCDHFGEKVAVEGDTAVVGAPVYRAVAEVGAAAGAAYVFTRNGNEWTEQAKLEADERIVGAKFGSSVSVSGETIIVGAPLEEENENVQGSAYVFTGNSGAWNQQARLLDTDPAAGSFFGISVDLSGDIAVVGAPFGNPAQGSRSGAAYVFVRDGDQWTERAKLMDPERPAYDWYGWNVAVSGRSVLVGAEPSGAAQIHELPPSMTAGARLAF
jgi:hypothetical protein